MVGTPWDPETTHIGSPSGLALVDGATFVVSAPNGDIFADQPQGLFSRDTRMLSTLLAEVDGHPLTLISTVPRGPFSVSIVTRAHHSLHPNHVDPPMTIIRHRTVGSGLSEQFDVRNHSLHPIEARFTVVFDADFASLFDVKGDAQESEISAQVEGGTDHLLLTPQRRAGPAAVLSTRVDLDPRPHDLDGHRASWNLELAPGQQTMLSIMVASPGNGQLPEVTGQAGQAPVEVRTIPRSSKQGMRLQSSDHRLERAAQQAIHDLDVLRIFDPDHADRVVVAAGAPWFMALFGRDSILTAWMALIADHQLAAGVLRSLADAQGRAEVAATEEQPGRILHEVRYDRRSVGLLEGSNVYYGTVDATPLFIMLVAEYLRWTNDRALMEELLPAVDRALDWIENFGDRDGDGFVEYKRNVESGLANQGWKDSWDGVRFADGRVAEAPIALCEVQAYVYGAYRAKAYLDRLQGASASAGLWEARAEDLRAAFDAAFWLDDRGSYAIGLDGQKRPIDSVTSNAGHCLWTGIVRNDRAAAVAEALTSSAMFSGWGLRTLSSENPGFNPLSYHCGSVWPHDTAIAVAGLARYGFSDQAELLRSGLLDAAHLLGGRLPELFAGFERSELPSPVAYPASCSPQAWAAASTLLLLRSMLGLDPDLPNGRLAVAGRLQAGPSRVAARGIPLAGGSISVEAGDGEITIAGLDSKIDLVVDP